MWQQTVLFGIFMLVNEEANALSICLSYQSYIQETFDCITLCKMQKSDS